MLTLLRSLLNVINTLNSERQLVTEALHNPDLSFTIPTAGTTTGNFRKKIRFIHSTGLSLFHLDVVTMMLKSKSSKI